MDKHIAYYDVLGHVVPGTLLFLSAAMISQARSIQVPLPPMSAPVQAIAFICVIIFLGQLVQALSSLLEPTYFRLMGGRPSDVVIAGRDKRLRGVLLETVKRALCEDLAAQEGDASDDQLFLHAAAIANKHNLGRVARFNALYGYHRAVLTVAILLVVISSSLWLIVWLTDPAVSHSTFIILLLVGVFLAALLWNRTKQRGFYYAREVVLMAHRHLLEKENESDA